MSLRHLQGSKLRVRNGRTLLHVAVARARHLQVLVQMSRTTDSDSAGQSDLVPGKVPRGAIPHDGMLRQQLLQRADCLPERNVVDVGTVLRYGFQCYRIT
uniref:(northern house mosquito) hypothetical protein n=1 Tax=Culex pipiens TaxID=7175 RepID=A0A8D8BX52_CULPI